jgi:hypothetical protein
MNKYYSIFDHDANPCARERRFRRTSFGHEKGFLASFVQRKLGGRLDSPGRHSPSLHHGVMRES